MKMETYAERADRLATRTTKPTLTDQSAAKDTDLNVIVKQFLKTGSAPGNPGQPMYEDFCQYPEDLRGYIEMTRSMAEHIGKLPKELKNMRLPELLALTPEQLTTILTPPAPKPETKDEPK